MDISDQAFILDRTPQETIEIMKRKSNYASQPLAIRLLYF
jgi:hypothetical protein